MDNTLLFVLIGVLAVAIVVFIVITLKQGKTKKLDVAKYQSAWLRIENSLQPSNMLSYSMAIVEADKLLDQALKDLGVAGKTLGERLKRSEGRFSEINHIWHAHKIRNQIAHEQGYQLNLNDAKMALKDFKRGLKDLGAI